MSSAKRIANRHSLNLSEKRRLSAAKATKVHNRNKTITKLLILAAVSSMFTDVLIYRFGGFPITLSHLLFVLANIALFFNWQRGDPRILTLWLLIVAVEIVHAFAMDFIVIPNWQRSFAQFFVYSLSFVLFTGLTINRSLLQSIAPWVLKLGIFLGSISLIQFGLFELGIAAHLPDAFRANPLYNPFLASRAGGFAPAMGFATEPARYAIGLVIIVACIVFLGNIKAVQNSGLRYAAIFALVGGAGATFSLTGLVMVIIVLTLSLAFSVSRKSLAITVAVGLFLLVTVGSPIFRPLQSRLLRAYRGQDNSTQVRVVASGRLLVNPLSETETTFLGTGMGMEERERYTYLDIYQDTALRTLINKDLNIHNIFATVRFLQGWFGLALYMILVWLIIRPLTRQWQIYLPIFTVYLLYHFASGYYLTPEFWSFSALVVLLRNASLEA